jgi:hypothetical protein
MHQSTQKEIHNPIPMPPNYSSSSGKKKKKKMNAECSYKRREKALVTGIKRRSIDSTKILKNNSNAKFSFKNPA